MKKFFKHRVVKFINFILMILSSSFLVSILGNYKKYLIDFKNGFSPDLLIPIGILLLFIFNVIVYFKTLGKRANNLYSGKIVLNVYDKFYTEIQMLLLALFIKTSIFVFSDLNAYMIIQNVCNKLNIYLNLPTIKYYDFNLIAVLSICTTFIMFPIGSIIKHIKNRSLFTNTLIYDICLMIDKLINKITKYQITKDQFKAKLITLFILALIPALGWIMILILGNKWKNEIAYDLEMIKETTRLMKKGELDLDTIKLNLETSNEISNNLTEIKSNINDMVEMQVKDEKEKINMILDASYDLKNPLESILENVTILEKDPELSTKNKKSIEIIKSRAERLKQLSNEINSGNSKKKNDQVKVEMKKIELFSFLAKGLSEIEQEMKKSNMNIKLNIKKAKINTYADENLLWRAFENLIKDVFKHGQKGTNVFISIEEEKGCGIISIRNEIKDELKDQLNITKDEFKNKFMSDPNKRTSLMVTKSLMEKQGGAMDVQIKDNYFIAYLMLKAID